MRPSFFLLILWPVLVLSADVQAQEPVVEARLEWAELPELPNHLGVAGPFAGVHNDVLIVAGGANFPAPTWESSKVWHDQIHVLVKDDDRLEWKDGGKLPRPTAYGAAVSTSTGLVCIGGNDAAKPFSEVFVLQWDRASQQITTVDFPSLPAACAFGSAALVGDTIYVAGGQSENGLNSAMTNFWALDLAKKSQPNQFAWNEIPAWPGSERAFNLTVRQHNGYEDCVYVIGGRYQATGQSNEGVEFLNDVWEFRPSTNTWRQRSDAPRPIAAGTGIGYGQSHIFVLGGADGSMFVSGAGLKDEHPGFVKEALGYHTITNTWTSLGATPRNHVTTIAVKWDDAIIIPSGEVRPRVRSPKIWRVSPKTSSTAFGTTNYVVLFGYLLSMVGVGLYFTRKNRNTDDFFRGGKQIPWWAAGCSIFATMLSSLTFTGIPSKSFAQDWVYSVGNMMIPVVAVLAVFVAMPFFRRIDATSAYEYLEKRFSRPVRLFGSGSFVGFHIFRMAIVMSLTGLALAVATPLTPAQSVLIMGVLSIVYCTMGGIEAVIWTDTIQTFVLMGGALLAIIILLAGVDGGWSGFVERGVEADKFAIVNLHWDATSAQIALWVIIVGGLAQNVSSYTADQAVVQRYMTTATQKLAARSIWVNAILTIPGTVFFFGIGSALFAYYQSHPEKLDPTITTDQIFPYFIANEMPIGLAGLIVAGIFAAAQSTVSTSMNSTATSIVTDFMRPFALYESERDYLSAARSCTFAVGVIGTLLGLVFVDPEIKSLFDTFIKIIGLFMGVLGGLFVLGAVTQKANGFGAMAGAVSGAAVMYCLWMFSPLNGYLYTACGILTCVVIGYLASFLAGQSASNLDGLTIHTLRLKAADTDAD